MRRREIPGKWLIPLTLVFALLTTALWGLGIQGKSEAKAASIDSLTESSFATAATGMIIVEDADSIWQMGTTTPPTGLVDAASHMPPRVVLQYADSICHRDLENPPSGLTDVASNVGPRILVEYANSICHYGLQEPFVTNNPPNQPSNVSPADGDEVSTTPALQSFAFSDPDSGDNHAASQWQITTTSSEYSSPTFDSGTDTTNLTSITISSGILDYSTIYYWHVRHQDNHDAWSSWSSETSFTTQVGPSDTTPPIVSSVSPEDTATDVNVSTNVTATFSEAMDETTIDETSFTLAGSAVSGTVTYNSDTYTATFTPDANLDYDHEYTATLSTAITDVAGNPLANLHTWSFTTTTEFEVGAITKVTNTGDSGLRIHRGDPTGETIKVVPDEWTLKIIGGPQCDIEEHDWWEIQEEKYEPSPVEGWVAEDFLREVSPEDFVPSSLPSYFIAAQDKVEQAIEWAESKEGSSEWEGWCLKFVREAFNGEPIAGWTSAEAARQQLETEGKFYSSDNCWNPPRGALVFFSASDEYEPYGHAGIYLGSQGVVHSYDKVRVDTEEGGVNKGIAIVERLSKIDSYIGWAYPPEEWLCPLYITSPLEITAKDTYYVGDALTANFTITNRGTESVTFDVLVVGGRGPFGEVVDFEKSYDVTLNPSDNYGYEGNLTLPDEAGTYHFFCAYHTEEHLPGENDYNWNTNIDVEVDGEIVEDFNQAKRYREADIIVFEKSYISPPPPSVLWEKIDGPWDTWPRSLRNWNEPPIIAVNPNNPKEIYVEAIHRTDNYWEDRGGRLYKSTDGGSSWDPIDKGLPKQLLSDYYRPIRAIAIAPSNPDIIYVGTSDFDPYSSGQGYGIYKSTNGGLDWTLVGGPETGRWIFKTYVGISSMAVDPTDPDIVYVGTMGEGIWRGNTKNGEETWEKIWDPPFVPPQYVMTEVNALAISPANPHIIYAAAYEFGRPGGHWTGTFRRYLLRSQQSGDKDTWESILSEEMKEMYKVDDIAVDNNNANTVYVITNNYKVYNSTDGGEKWSDASGTDGANPLPSQPPTYASLLGRYGKCASISMNHDYSNVIYAAGQWELESVYFSGDSGTDWYTFGDPPLKDGVKELVFASDVNSHVLYAAAIHGLYKCNISGSVTVAREHSPAELRVYDSEGRVTGLVYGETKDEIPSSIYDQESKTVTILFPTDSYYYELVGTDEGEYGLEVVSLKDGEATTFAATDIPTTGNATHQYTIDWDALSEGEAGVTIKKDSDGDGEFEETIVTSQPNTPSNPSPSNGVANISAQTDLSWTGGDPDPEDIVTYDVYFGTNSTPPLKEAIGPYAANQTSISYKPEPLSYNTTYYWKIVARDDHGIIKEGPVWDFTTPSACFIATAAYGTPTAEEIDILREFRDEVLLPNRVGAELVSFYYRVSPPVADFISRHEVLRTIVREGFIDPLVAIVKYSQNLWLDLNVEA